jgi:hypothetical protein
MTRLTKLYSAALALATFVTVFTGTIFTGRALAASAADPAAADPSVLELLKPVYDAFAGHRPALGVALGLIALCALLKRWGGAKLPFLHTNAGGSLLVLVASAATASSAALLAPGAKFSLDLLWSSTLVGVGAAGGYAVIKNLIIDPLLPKLPAWAQTLLAPVMWVFDSTTAKPADIALAEAVKAGEKAVAANPGLGAESVLGVPLEIK